MRNVLRAVADHIAVRNGDIGSGDQAYLTMGDLTGNKRNALELAKAVAPALASGGSAPGQPLADLADALRDRILRSPYWQEMFTRLQAIDAPDTVPGSPAWKLLREARERGAAIDHVQNVVQGVNESLVNVRDTLTTAIGDNAAAISSEVELRTTADTAILNSVKEFITSVGQSFAGVEQKITLRTNNENALAEAINTIWARVGANEGLIQSGEQIAVNPVGSVVTKFDQLQAVVRKQADDLGNTIESAAIIREDLKVSNTAIDGLKGKWGVKVDLDGYVAGVSLNAGVDPQGRSESMFIVLSDIFAVGAPGKPTVVPFAIDATTGLVAIDGNLVATGTISAKQLSAYSVQRDKLALKVVGGAQIDDLAVDTLKLANQSVTTMEQFNDVIYGKTPGSNNGSKYFNSSFYMAHPGDAYIITVSQFFSNSPNADWSQVEVTCDGMAVGSGIERKASSVQAPNVIIGKVTLSAGWKTVQVKNQWANIELDNTVVNTTSVVVFRAYK